ncbi:uncharacterized protein [Trachinotus anak]
MDVSLGLVLLQVKTFFKKEIFLIFIAGVWTILTGFSLVFGGRKPSYCCVKYNVCFHLATLIFSAVAFGAMVRHVPYKERRYCESYCDSVHHETMVLVGSILAVLITIFLVEVLISLAVMLIGWCAMLFNYPQESEDPEHIGSTTSEPLCLPPQQQMTPGGESMNRQLMDGQNIFKPTETIQINLLK